MRLMMVTVMATALAIQPGLAQARGPNSDVAADLAKIAVATCGAQGFKVAALVVDSAGAPVARLSADGADGQQGNAVVKASTVIRYKIPSGEAAAAAEKTPALAADLAADGRMGWPGGLPLMVKGVQIGAIAVAGAPGGDKDEACAKAAIDQAGARLR